MPGPGNILIKIGADAGQAVRELSTVNKSLGETMTGSEKMSAGLKKAAVPAAAALVAIGAGAKVAIDAASDLHEQVSKTATVFGPAGKEMVAWSKTLTHSFGISQEAALEASGTFGNMLVPMGIARGDAAKMSKTMVQLAGDMASFNNASPEDTLDAIRSGLAGEAEPLRKFGVFLDQASISAQAVSMGLVKAQVDMGGLRKQQVAVTEAQQKSTQALAEHGKKSFEYTKALANQEYQEDKLKKLMEGKVPALTAAQKAQASYGLIMKQTSDAQGDFAKTSDGAANQARIQAAEMENLKASLGQSLLPAYQMILSVMTATLGVLSQHQGAIKALVAAVAALAGAVLIANAAMKVYAAAQVAIRAATAAWTAVQWLLNAALNANPIGLVVVAVAALTAGIILAYRHSATFRGIVQSAMGAVKTAVDAVAGAFRSLLAAATAAFQWIVGHWQLALFAFGPIGAAIYLIITNFRTLKAVAETVADAVSSAIRKIGDAIGYVVGLVKDLIGWLGRIHVPHIDLPGPFAATSSGSGAGARSYSPGRASAPITVNVYGAIDPEGTARAIRRVLAGSDRRSGRIVTGLY